MINPFKYTKKELKHIPTITYKCTMNLDDGTMSIVAENEEYTTTINMPFEEAIRWMRQDARLSYCVELFNKENDL